MNSKEVARIFIGLPGGRVLLGCPTWSRARTLAAVLLLAGLVGSGVGPSRAFESEMKTGEPTHTGAISLETASPVSDNALRRFIQEVFAYDERLISVPRV